MSQSDARQSNVRRRQRVGALAEKVGMTSLFTKNGELVPVTVLKMSGCRVVAHMSKEGGNHALQMGIGTKKHPSKAAKGYFAKSGMAPTQTLKEFPVGPEGILPVGTVLSVEHFAVGRFVDVTGVTIGKGFAGAMKRHNFSGLRASHGVSVSHRSHGSTGNRKSPAKVFKNKKMAGHMGCVQVTIQSLEVMATDEALGVIAVKGAVPGFKTGLVWIRDAIKKPITEQHVFPGGVSVESSEGVAESSTPSVSDAMDVSTDMSKNALNKAEAELPDASQASSSTASQGEVLQESIPSQEKTSEKTSDDTAGVSL